MIWVMMMWAPDDYKKSGKVNEASPEDALTMSELFAQLIIM
jgi:hypothetical protein